MERSKVYFTDFRTHIDVSQGVKLQRLIKAAGIGNIDFEGRFVAIKTTIGKKQGIAYCS